MITQQDIEDLLWWVGLHYGEENKVMTKEERKARLTKAEIERYKAQGLTEFFYGENSVWALNQKSADKKARKRHWL